MNLKQQINKEAKYELLLEWEVFKVKLKSKLNKLWKSII